MEETTVPPKRHITFEEAENLLRSGDYIHTLRNAPGILFGCDWSREGLLEHMKKHESTLEIAGETARRMEHGLALYDDSGPLFIETDTDKLDLFDPKN